MPANAWFPGALVSFFFPGLGLLFVPRSEIKTLGVKIFVGYLAASIGLLLIGCAAGWVADWAMRRL